MESIVLRPARSSKDFKSGLKTSQEGLTQAITQEKTGFSLAGLVKKERKRGNKRAKMKELGWRQESLTNSSSRPPIQIRSTRSDHMIKELFMKKKKPISILLMIRKRLIRAL